MGDSTLDALERAYRATPQNVQLLIVLLGTLLERGAPEKAHGLLVDGPSIAISDPSHRHLAARVCLEAGDAELALIYARDETSDTLLLGARVRAFPVGERR